jgi:hypothetical protein
MGREIEYHQEPMLRVRVVEICNTTSSLLHFEIKNIFLYFEKRSSLLQRWHCMYAHSCVGEPLCLSGKMVKMRK